MMNPFLRRGFSPGTFVYSLEKSRNVSPSNSWGAHLRIAGASAAFRSTVNLTVLSVRASQDVAVRLTALLVEPTIGGRFKVGRPIPRPPLVSTAIRRVRDNTPYLVFPE
jgi:hypothetical protein